MCLRRLSKNLAAGRVLIESFSIAMAQASAGLRDTEVLHKAADDTTGRIGMTVRVEPGKADAVRRIFRRLVTAGRYVLVYGRGVRQNSCRRYRSPILKILMLDEAAPLGVRTFSNR